MTVQDRQSFFAYNLWLEQRGLSRVSFATYRGLFPDAPPVQPQAQAAPRPEEPQPQKPRPEELQPEKPRPSQHLICWLIGGEAVAPELMTKIKRATCVPLSYMTQFSLADHQAIATALAERPAATIAVLATADMPLPPQVADHPALWRLPHPASFQQPGVKAAFWAQLKELMAAVAETPSL